MEDKKGFWGTLKYILAGFAAGILIILGIKKRKTDKQVEENLETVDTIENSIEDIQKIADDIDDKTKEAEEIVEEANEVVEEVKSHEEHVVHLIKSNREVLEKYSGVIIRNRHNK